MNDNISISVARLKSWVLGYLHVLNDQEILGKLTLEELDVARESMLGCLVHLIEYLESQEEVEMDSIFVYRAYLQMIQLREMINHKTVDGCTPYQVALHELATKKCAGEMYELLRSI